MPVASSVQWIDRVAFTERIGDGTATYTIHFREGCEPEKVSFEIRQFQSGEVTFTQAQGDKQTYDFVDDVHVIALHSLELIEAEAWHQRNAFVPEL
jgi:hypothetical protein